MPSTLTQLRSTSENDMHKFFIEYERRSHCGASGFALCRQHHPACTQDLLLKWHDHDDGKYCFDLLETEHAGGVEAK